MYRADTASSTSLALPGSEPTESTEENDRIPREGREREAERESERAFID